MAYTTISKSSDYFKTKLYTGNGSAGHSITGVGHQPDFVWMKPRTEAENHALYDVVRGTTKRLMSNDGEAQETRSNGLSAFGTDGFTVNADNGENKNTIPMVAWCWKAGAGQGSSNTAGSINTTYTSVSTTAGFSISQYTGTGSAATVGHGLGVAPKVVMVKNLSSSGDWRVYTETTGNQSQLSLSQDSVADSGNTAMWNSTSPTTTTFSIGTHAGVNENSSNFIAYCFASKTGFSKFGEYAGNGNADGSFIYTGFKPAWILVKCTNASEYWHLYDNIRSPINEAKLRLLPNVNNAESTEAGVDLLSNGFKWRNSASNFNGSSKNYIYLAFAEEPLVASNGTPATAR